MRAADPEIIFEDTHLIVISKPAGLLSQGEVKGDLNLVDWLRAYFGRHYVGLIHRLDRNTSGLMVAAKRSKAAARLSAALQAGEIRRVYWAWLCGRLDQPAQWRHWLCKDEATNQVRAYRSKKPETKEAVLAVKPLDHKTRQGQEVTLAEFWLETGRSHQVRVQSACEGFPLAGDLKYGAQQKCAALINRPALHSALLEFPHPMSGEVLRFKKELPEDMRW